MPPYIITPPKVSAIVSVYKAERFIRGCLEDLVAQTLFRQEQLEIVVVNSGSPQHEDTIIREYVVRYPGRINYIRTVERETIYQAWNRGIAAARGRYITNANADDRHRPDALEVMAKTLDANPKICLAYADSNVTREENAVFDHAPLTARFLWPDFNPVRLFQVCYVGPQPIWRRSLHERYGFFDGACRSAGDYDYWLRLVAAGERFFHIRETLGLYLQSPSGVEYSNQEISWQESASARKRNWPSSWGAMPQPEGCYLIPITKPTPEAAASQPLVSVVVPTCNRPELLAQALQSILGQTYRHFEILVVNDGGVDVGELIDYLDPEGRIRYFNLHEKVERSAARNLALKESRGKYIAYLDDDDRYYPQHLETLVSHLETSAYRVAYTDAYRETREERSGVQTIIKKDVPFSYDFDAARLLVENYIPILCLMHERSLLEETGMFDETLTRLEDWDLLIRLAQHSRFVHIPELTCEFTHHFAGSTMSAANAPLFLNSCKLIFARYAHLTGQNWNILQWQRKVLHHKTCYLYDYLLECLSPLLKDRSLQSSTDLEQTYRDVVDKGVSVAQLESALAWIEGKSGNADSAECLFRQALQADEDNVRAREDLINLLLRQHRYEEAARHLEVLLVANPADEETVRALVDIYHVIMVPSKSARKIIEKALMLTPDNGTLRELESRYDKERS